LEVFVSIAVPNPATTPGWLVAPRPPEGTAPLDRVLARVADTLGTTPSAILRAGHGTRQVSFARHAAMYLAHTVLGMSYGQVARALRRDRTTVMYAVRRVEAMREDRDVDRLMYALEWSLRDLAPGQEGGR
jgi:chromosomal replication initiation ATPase DnaA